MTDGQNNAGKVAAVDGGGSRTDAERKSLHDWHWHSRQGAVSHDRLVGAQRYQWEDVDVDEDTLKKIADGMTGGRYYRADSTEMFNQIYAEIDRLEKTEVEVKKYQHFDELYSKGGPGRAGGGPGLELALGHTVWRKLP